MKKIFLIIGLLGMLVFMLPLQAVQAQEGTTAIVASTTIPISPEIRKAINDWLATSPPSSAIYYGITYTHTMGVNKHYVCLVGLSIPTPDTAWSFTGDDEGNSYVVWTGTVIVTFMDDGSTSVQMYANDPATTAMIKSGGALFAPAKFNPNYGMGGGPYVRFPMQASKAWYMGLLGVHAVGCCEATILNNWRAVDFYSGSAYGSGAANDSVYASIAGTVDFVCEDDYTTAVRVSGGGDSLIYGNVLDNASLEIDHEFDQGDVIGTMKHGSFSGLLSGNCGQAIQTADTWNVHWGFVVNSNGKFQAEGCILDVNDIALGPQRWVCGDTVISGNMQMTHVGDISNVLDDGTVGMHVLPGANNMNVPSFWTLLEDGLGAVFDALVVNALPEHSGPSGFAVPILNGVKIVFRIATVLVFGYLNLFPAMQWVKIAIELNLALRLAFLAGTIMRLLKG